MRFTYKRIYFHAWLFFVLQLLTGIILMIYRPGMFVAVISGALIAITTWIISALIYPMEIDE